MLEEKEPFVIACLTDETINTCYFDHNYHYHYLLIHLVLSAITGTFQTHRLSATIKSMLIKATQLFFIMYVRLVYHTDAKFLLATALSKTILSLSLCLSVR